MEAFEIKSRWTGKAIYTCELSAEVAGRSYSAQLGFAVRSAYRVGADLRGAVLRGAELRKCPVAIKGIHQAVYAAASAPQALDMRSWHSCETTHCRAGWVVALAGEGGAALEYSYGTSTAAALIYMASDPSLDRIPDFYCDNETALADMKRLAEAEAQP